jgi:hypothetical protein
VSNDMMGELERIWMEAFVAQCKVMYRIPAFGWRYWGTTKILNQGSRSPGRDFNLRTLIYEAGVLTTRP